MNKGRKRCVRLAEICQQWVLLGGHRSSKVVTWATVVLIVGTVYPYFQQVGALPGTLYVFFCPAPFMYVINPSSNCHIRAIFAVEND